MNPSLQEPTFTPAEAAAFSGVPLERVRKEIELGVIAPAKERGGNRVWLSALEVAYLAVLGPMEASISPEGRKALCKKVSEALAASREAAPLSPYLEINIEALRENFLPRLAQWLAWKGKIVRNREILGGEPVFPNSRLAVRQIGGMLLKGESAEAILGDYPYLTLEDLEFARLFFLAEPPMGRPKKREKPGRGKRYAFAAPSSSPAWAAAEKTKRPYGKPAKKKRTAS